MATNETPAPSAPQDDADGDALIEQLRLLSEPESLVFYSRLTPKLQWLARKRTTGQQRKALIVYHAVTFGW